MGELSEFIETDWKGKFNPRFYLEEYYNHIGRENSQLIAFLVRSFAKIPTGFSMIDVGTGPTAYQLIAAAKRCKEIYCMDLLNSNLNELKKWLVKDRYAFDWTKFTKGILRAESGRKMVTNEDILVREEITRSKVKKLQALDIKKNLPNKLIKGFDVVSSQFVSESITSSVDEFESAVKNISLILKSPGYLVLSAIKSARAYKVGTNYFPAVAIDEQFLKTALIANDFTAESIKIKSIKAEKPDEQLYKGLIFVTATK